MVGTRTRQIDTEVTIKALKETHAATQSAKLQNTTLDELKEELDEAENEEG